MARPKITIRYPLEPLLRLAGGHSAMELAGIASSEISRARTEGLTELRADRWALRCGLTPYEVWPEMVDAAIDEVMVECEAPDCDVRFVPSPRAHGGKHRYCHQRCARRHWAAKARAAARAGEPEAVARRERELDRARRYHQETRDYALAESRRRYRERVSA